MLAIQASLLTLLEPRKQFLIPIYQRTYSWTEKQCRQLWADIVRTAQNSQIQAHFIGSVVYIKDSLHDTPMTVPPKMLVIDGQQRLMTLSLLLIALREALKEAGNAAPVPPEQIEEFLINKFNTGDLRHKLVLTQSDKDTLSALIDGRPQPAAPSLRIADNFRFFQEQIQASGVGLDVLFQGVHKLMLVDISLDRNYDNPQLIFESLNSTGLDLSQADLIRNFILMGQDPGKQTDLYNDHWFPMEQSFGHAEYSAQFDRFMRDYLTIKTGHIPNVGEVYAAFKAYVQSHPALTIQDIIADVHKFSGFFTNLAFGKESDPALKAAIADINALKVDVAYPFLLEAYSDYESGTLTQPELLKVLRLVESYVFRRAICAIPTNTLNKTFAGLRAEVKPSAYLESLEAALLLKDSYRRFPRDDEFRAQLVVRDVYNIRTRNYLLDKLENFGRREPVRVEEYTIEHIMPQTENLAAAWQQDLGANWKHVHDTYLHTLGNLTLTGYNSEYNARPFLEKRDFKDKDGLSCGLANSPLRLNQGLGQLDHWNEAEIQQRAGRLADKALAVWPFPALPASVLAGYAAPNPTPAPIVPHDDAFFRGRRPLFEELEKRVLNLDASVEQEPHRNYLQFRTENNFLAVRPQKIRLRLTVNMPIAGINDPQGLCRDVSGKNYYGGGETLLALKTDDQIDDVMAIVKQAYDRSLEVSNGNDAPVNDEGDAVEDADDGDDD